MAKAEFMSPKDIANRMKAKGLQKLKFYCQACQRQMRDENGFKCHIMSESHQRQMLLVADNPGKYVYNYSQEFKKEFLNLLSRRHGTKRVLANRVYQEYIADKNHIHMNATRWTTLTGFCHQMGKEGILRVDETERGLHIAWVDNSPKALAKQAAIQKMERARKDDEERDLQLLKEQIEKASKVAEEKGMNTTEPAPTELKREGEQPIKLNLSLKPTAVTTEAPISTGSKMMLGGMKKRTGLSALAKRSSTSSSNNNNNHTSMKVGGMMTMTKRKASPSKDEETDNKKMKS
ncbi:domain of Kin17 curved DNA-binding protein-domain-containing protein [Cokeromyces recurvatus]|uniref:domain of Kin17 curved DNA-binding protein-domain-containing protein n=1 Tax=Cokeromyces recurvatus TaxID=90255 RepID=UPI00221F04B3|nr:domain of Kin17 curved DNA-binding protein-domain-containing protein [Cokeromyces recurvatus]KAI7905707.1 domain of Kin17 curved DNA-binding protein-domain-containing protein [Cokeromyces recurvatus]